MSDVRIGVIGAGNMGADHVATLHHYISGATVTMVADIAEERAQSAAVPGALATNDPYALIADARVDAVVIASHDNTHAELAIAALRAGKPLMCEKPLAPTVDECLQVAREEQRSGASLLSLGFMRRFDPAYTELKANLVNGACGTPLLMHCIARGVSSAPGATSEFSITGSAIHEFDIVPWLLDSPITEVSWHAPRSTTVATGLQDPQLILLRTADGVLTTVEIFLNAQYGYDIRCEIAGERGTLALAQSARLIKTSEGTQSTDYAADWRPRFADAYRLELQAWIDAVATGQPSRLAAAHDGVRAAAVAEAVITSMKDGGRTISVEVPGD